MYNREHKRQVLKEQALNGNGSYYKYLKAIYNLYLEDANAHKRDYATNISIKAMMLAVYNCNELAYVSKSTVLQYQNDLQKLGYISVQKVDDEYRIYLLEELDF